MLYHGARLEQIAIEFSLLLHFQVDGVEGILKQYLIEPFIPHQQNEEFYLCIYSRTVSKDVVLFHHEGGVDVGNVDEKVWMKSA